MTEPSTNDTIAFTSALIASLLLALLAAGALKLSEIGAMFRESAEDMESGQARSHVLAFAKKLEAAESESEAERLLMMGWLPKEIVGTPDPNALN